MPQKLKSYTIELINGEQQIVNAKAIYIAAKVIPNSVLVSSVGYKENKVATYRILNTDKTFYSQKNPCKMIRWKK